MSRIDDLNRRYEMSASLARDGVEVIAAGDPAGARLNAAVRRLLVTVHEDGSDLWEDLAGAAKVLRWRLVTQPQPVELNSALRDGAEQVARQSTRLRGAVANELLLDELAAAAAGVTEFDPLLGTLLLRSIEEVGFSECVVVAANKVARAGLKAWLGDRGVAVYTAGELDRERRRIDQAYVIGPPRLFKSSLVTAPVTSQVSFLMPAWYGDRTVPCSPIARYAEGGIRVKARILTEGDCSEPESDVVDVDDELLPQPIWGMHPTEREPALSEVSAQKVLLSGNLAMWLDDGERIRALDPQQPVGERVIYTDVDAVREGTYLLLRRGETERGALYKAALRQLGIRGQDVDATQHTWKRLLGERLAALGYREVVRRMKAEGIKTAERARAWTEPNLIRPHSDQDFQRLLEWIDIPVQPTFGNATMLRKAIYQASAEVREALETAVSAADLAVLDRDGNLTLDVESEGFRGILATRVLAVSPHTQIVARHDARVPFEDRSGQWLE